MIARAGAASSSVRNRARPASSVAYIGSTPCVAAIVTRLENASIGFAGHTTRPCSARSNTSSQVVGGPSRRSGRYADTWAAASAASANWWPWC